MNSVCCPICKSESIQFSLKTYLHSGSVKDIFRCLDCNSSFYFPVPSEEDIKKCYSNSYYADFLKRYWNEFYNGRRYAKMLKRWKEKGRFLDIGCSIGTMLYGIRSDSDWDVVGIELTSSTAETARRLHGVTVFSEDIFHFPGEKETFDYILINNVLEHVPNPAAFLAKAASLLKFQGRLELICPNGPVDILPNRILFKKKSMVLRTTHSGHLYFFSHKALKMLIRRSGLKILSLLNFHFKSALKARGWFPFNALSKFEENHQAISAENSDEQIPEIGSIPPKNKSWLAYCVQNNFQIRVPYLRLGYDFKVLCEKL